MDMLSDIQRFLEVRGYDFEIDASKSSYRIRKQQWSLHAQHAKGYRNVCGSGLHHYLADMLGQNYQQAYENIYHVLDVLQFIPADRQSILDAFDYLFALQGKLV